MATTRSVTSSLVYPPLSTRRRTTELSLLDTTADTLRSIASLTVRLLGSSGGFAPTSQVSPFARRVSSPEISTACSECPVSTASLPPPQGGDPDLRRPC